MRSLQTQVNQQAVATAFHATDNLDDVEFAPDDDIRPITSQPIIRLNNDSGERDLVMAHWGFVPGWHKPEEKFPPTTFKRRG